MNIFVTDIDPKISARNLLDRHISKMVLESSQILSNCFTLENLSKEDCPKTQKNQARKHSYPKHPCCLWAKKTKNNMQWLIEHAKAIDEERKNRKNSKNSHFSMNFILWAEKNINDSIVPDGELTPFVLAMPEEYKTDNPIQSYRNYYKFGKKHLHKWTKNKPDWI